MLFARIPHKTDKIEQWCGESEAAGEAAQLMLPPSNTFLPLGLGHVSCGRHNMQ